MSRPNKAHPLFSGLVKAAIARSESNKLFTEDNA
jgi:CTP synthase (UTP-ammonia lyase)